MKMSARTGSITSTRSKTSDVRAGPAYTNGVPRDTGPPGEHAEPRGAEENTEIYTEGVRPGTEVPGLTQANIRRLEDKDSVAAALASVLSSLPPSETTPIPGLEVANAKVKAWKRGAMKGKEKDAALGLMFGATWGDGTFEVPYCEMDWPALAQSSEWEPDGVVEEPTRSREPNEPECLNPEPCPSGVAPGPSCVETGLLLHMGAPKLHLDEQMELLSRVLGPGDESRDLSALSAAVKAKLQLFELK